MKNLVFLFICFVSGNNFSDSRCRCLCPPLKSINPVAKVYFGDDKSEATTCTSEKVVRPKIESDSNVNDKDLESTIEAYCNSCDCNYELRNTGTMRVIVYIYITSIVVLILYTSFVYFITEKYQPRETEESMTSPLFPDGRQRGPVENIISRIDSMARRWKADVDQQRNTVFKRREALQ